MPLVSLVQTVVWTSTSVHLEPVLAVVHALRGMGQQLLVFVLRGFTGTRCDIDLPFCEVDTCLNGGDML